MGDSGEGCRLPDAEITGLSEGDTDSSDLLDPMCQLVLNNIHIFTSALEVNNWLYSMIYFAYFENKF